LYSASKVSAIFSWRSSSLFSAAKIEACLFLFAMNLFSQKDLIEANEKAERRIKREKKKQKQK